MTTINFTPKHLIEKLERAQRQRSNGATIASAVSLAFVLEALTDSQFEEVALFVRRLLEFGGEQ